MDLQLAGQRAYVSGGTAGIGLEIAKTLASEGVEVTISSRQAEKLAQGLAALEGVAKAEVRGLVIDVTTAAGVVALTDRIPDVDILINNLGIYEPKRFDEITDDDWQRLFDINVMSGVRLSRHYMAGMLRRNAGRIIFISSETGILSPPEMIHYGMTKSAQLAISRGLAELTMGTSVTVNAVLPGPTRSEGLTEFLRAVASDPSMSYAEAEAELFRNHRSNSLLRHFVDPAEVGRLVAYLVSPLTAATNGAALRVDGGLVRSIV